MKDLFFVLVGMLWAIFVTNFTINIAESYGINTPEGRISVAVGSFVMIISLVLTGLVFYVVKKPFRRLRLWYWQMVEESYQIQADGYESEIDAHSRPEEKKILEIKLGEILQGLAHAQLQVKKLELKK